MSPDFDSGMNDGTDGQELERVANFYTGTEENPTSAQSAPTPRAEQDLAAVMPGGNPAVVPTPFNDDGSPLAVDTSPASPLDNSGVVPVINPASGPTAIPTTPSSAPQVNQAQRASLVSDKPSPPLYEGFWWEVLKTLKGEGKAVANTVVGLGSVLRHPINTLQGIAQTALNPFNTGMAAGASVRAKIESGSEGQGEVAGDVILLIAPVAAAKVVSKAKALAQLAEGAEAVGGLAEGAGSAANLAEGLDAAEGAAAAGESAAPLAEGAGRAGELGARVAPTSKAIAPNANQPPARFAVNGKSFVTDRSLANAGKALDPSDTSGVLTKAGRALEKNGSRPGSAFPRATGNAAAKNAQGQAALESILGDAGTTAKPNRFGGVDYIAPGGQGARYNGSGEFMEFLEP